MAFHYVNEGGPLRKVQIMEIQNKPLLRWKEQAVPSLKPTVLL